MKRQALALAVFLAAATTAATEGDPTRACLDALRQRIDAIGPVRAGEVASERDELQGVLSQLQRDANDIGRTRALIESEQGTLDMLNRERASTLAGIEHQQQVLNGEVTDLRRRKNEHEADRVAYGVSCGFIREEDAIRCEIWGQQIVARSAAGNAELARLTDRQSALDGQRQQVASGDVAHAQRAKWLDKRRSLVDRETATLLGTCAAAQSRATAVRQIADAPARTVEYQPPDAVAKQVVTGLMESVGSALAEDATTLIDAKATIKLMKNVGIKVTTLVTGAAYVLIALDVISDVGHAGADQNAREAAKNLLLIGDYALARKRQVEADRSGAAQDPTYIAMGDEMQRLQSEMPSSTTDAALRSFSTSGALGEALMSAAARYVGGRVEKLGYGTAHIRTLNNAQRKALGPGGVKGLRGTYDAIQGALAESSVETGALAVTTARENIKAARSNK